VIVFREVHKAFGPKRVLEGFSLDIPDGQTTVIVGYSGAGKSVALKLIVGLLEPDHGAVEVDGQVVHLMERESLTALRSRIGFVFQFAALFDSMTVAENLAVGLRRHGIGETEIAERSAEALAMVGLSGSEGRYPGELSGGMRKRVGIARAVVLRPRYILYDEPTTGLDPVTAAVMNQLMVRARETYGVTGVVVTHDMHGAYTVGDRIAMLYRGQVRQVGSVEAIRGSHDPVVRQFVEGRPEGALDAERAEGGVS
jgi:phospholipid/cholesterol/gamma-HCH transport system ATP-binding protein